MRGSWPRRGLGLLLLPALCVLGVAGCSGPDRHHPPDASPTPTPSTTPTPQLGGTFGGIPTLVADVSPAVVTVAARGRHGGGVIYNSHGLVITLYRLVRGSHKITVWLDNGMRTTGRVITDDPAADLALVQIAGTNLPTVTFAGSLPAPGNLAVLVAGADSAGPAASAGVVSAIDKDLPAGGAKGRPLAHLLQTDMTFAAGQAGAPLVNYAGRVIGLAEPYRSAGYAVPSTTALDVIAELAKTGRVRMGYLGVSTETLTPQLGASLGPTPSTAPSPLATSAGAVILSVARHSPAAVAGLLPGDVILAVDGAAVDSVTELYAALDQHAPGDQLSLTVLAAGHVRQVPVTLSTPPP
jgi:S1-C subfamily serine protease